MGAGLEGHPNGPEHGRALGGFASVDEDRRGKAQPTEVDDHRFVDRHRGPVPPVMVVVDGGECGHRRGAVEDQLVGPQVGEFPGLAEGARRGADDLPPVQHRQSTAATRRSIPACQLCAISVSAESTSAVRPLASRAILNCTDFAPAATPRK